MPPLGPWSPGGQGAAGVGKLPSNSRSSGLAAALTCSQILLGAGLGLDFRIERHDLGIWIVSLSHARLTSATGTSAFFTAAAQTQLPCEAAKRPVQEAYVQVQTPSPSQTRTECHLNAPLKLCRRKFPSNRVCVALSSLSFAVFSSKPERSSEVQKMAWLLTCRLHPLPHLMPQLRFECFGARSLWNHPRQLRCVRASSHVAAQSTCGTALLSKALALMQKRRCL
jgi:hypothetical protein